MSEENQTLVEVAKEEQAESDAVLKKIHRPVRAWYKKSEFKAKHGRFPLFWQVWHAVCFFSIIIQI